MQTKTRRAVAIIVACLVTLIASGAYLVYQAAGPAPVSHVRSVVYAPTTNIVLKSSTWRDDIRALDEPKKEPD